MKNFIIKTLAILSLSTIAFSCDREIPEDIHEHDEIEKVVVTIVNKQNTSEVQTITYIGGTQDKHLHLENGETYLVSLDFQVKHDDHYDSMNSEIIEEKNEHFITYEFADANINVTRAADDIVRNDGKKLGLKTEWTVTSLATNGRAVVKLVHAANSVDDKFPTNTNQQGKTTGGETDVNMSLQIHEGH